MLKKKNLLLLLILLLGFLLRFISLDISPPGFNADEAALGYNAYSILKTGKDEWGESFPIVFKSFSDYKPGLYVYLTIPFVALFGLTELSVRLPSILLGSISIIIIYLLSKEIFKSEVASLSSAFLLAISPWHIHYSRGAWESNVATFFLLLGVYAFVKALENHKYYFLSGVAFVASIYVYQSTRLVVPLVLLGILLIHFKKLNLKEILPAVILCAILLLPLIFVFISGQGLARFQGVSIFGDLGPINRLNEERGEHQNQSGYPAKIFHNKFTAYGYNFVNNYFEHFSPNFLFVNGDMLGRNKVPFSGQMYFFEMLTIILGIILLVKRKYENQKIIFIWLLAAPVAAALTYQSPTALRSHNMVIPLILISGIGLGGLIDFFKKRKFKVLYSSILSLVIFYFFAQFLHQYFVHLPKQYALEWQYGFSEAVSFTESKKNSLEKIVFTNRYDQPYILVLFYSKYDPEKYQKEYKKIGDNNFGFTTINAFDKYEFRKITIDKFKERNVMYVTSPSDYFDERDNAHEIINYPNGDFAFKIIEYR